MQKTLNLLFVNILDPLVTNSLSLIQNGNFDTNYKCIYNKIEVHQALNSGTNWDLILVSENSTVKFPTLKYVKNHSNNIPIIFLTKEKAKQKAVPAMQNGADDCVSLENMGRLLPIIKRELRNKLKAKKISNYNLSKDLLSNIFNYFLDEVYIFSLWDLKCLYLNRAALEKNQYDRQHIHQLSPTDIYVDYNPSEFQTFIMPLLKGTQEKISVCIRKKEKNILNTSKTQFRLLEWEGQSYLLTINKDISALQEKTRKLNKQQKITQGYAQSSKMKSEFLSDAAHDIRTSLNSIILSNMLVAKRIGKNPESDLKKLTSAINHSSNYLLNYLDEFFDSPVEQWGHKHTKIIHTDAQVFGQKLYYIFDPVAQKNGIDFDYEVADLVNTKIKTNPTYLKRIIKNILANAFKYTPHGFITLRIYNPDKKELKKVQFDSEYAIAFQIEDTGIGIPEAEQEKIFERHSRSKKALKGKFKGSGLGLNICQQLTEGLGGLLHVDSEENSGSTFTLYLPDRKPEDKNITENIVSNRTSLFETPDGKENKLNKTILIIDDSQTHNLAIRELLGYAIEQCITATSKQQAYQILEKKDIDCIILDYAINNESCLDIARYIKGHSGYNMIPIIIYTGKNLSQKQIEELNKYARAIVKKNIGSHKILTGIIRSLFESTNQT